MQHDDIGLVVRTVANLGTCSKDQIKHALAMQMQQRSGHVPNHVTLDALIDRALSSGRITRDKDMKLNYPTGY